MRAHDLKRCILALDKAGRDEDVEEMLRRNPCRAPKSRDGKLARSTEQRRLQIIRKSHRYAESLAEAENGDPPFGPAERAAIFAMCGQPHAALSEASDERIAGHMSALVDVLGSKTDEWISSRKEAIAAAPRTIEAPLVLISQIQRSGGSLLSQLFDGHSKVAAHPYELKIGYPMKTLWPRDSSRSGAVDAFHATVDPWIADAAMRGLVKQTRAAQHAVESLPFLLPMDTFKQVFAQRFDRLPPGPGARRIVDAYFTAFFSCLWLGECARNPDFITAFVPRLGTSPREARHFFSAYPEGRMIHISRDPVAWYSSARAHHSSYADADSAISAWTACSRGALLVKQEFGDCLAVISFEDLVLDTEAVMGRLCRWLGLELEPALLSPTFCGWPMRANSSFVDSVETGVRPETAAREAGIDPGTAALIRDRAGTLRDQILSYSL